MCGPEGTALFYCRKEVQDQLQLTQFGWHMLKDAFDFSAQNNALPLAQKIAAGAQRFESGSPNMMGITALNASLGMLLEIGMENVQSRVIENADYLLNQLALPGDIKIVSPTATGTYAGIVTFQKLNVDNVKLYQHLQDNNVICAYRGEGIRFSQHFHTEIRVMDKALKLVNNFTG